MDKHLLQFEYYQWNWHAAVEEEDTPVEHLLESDQLEFVGVSYDDWQTAHDGILHCCSYAVDYLVYIPFQIQVTKHHLCSHTMNCYSWDCRHFAEKTVVNLLAHSYYLRCVHVFPQMAQYHTHCFPLLLYMVADQDDENVGRNNDLQMLAGNFVCK